MVYYRNGRGLPIYANMSKQIYLIRNARAAEFGAVGKLMVQVYSELDGFPKESEQPGYFLMLAKIGELTNNPETELLVAVSAENKIAGAVIFVGDMKYYGSGGSAYLEENAAGFRLLAVAPLSRGQDIGKMLVQECIQKARGNKYSHMIIHSTKHMKIAWAMYMRLGFKRSEDLDFMQGELPVFGFRLLL